MNRAVDWLKLNAAILTVIFYILFILGSSRLDYSFYQLLRFLVCGVCAYYCFFCYALYKKESDSNFLLSWLLILGFLAFIFNPLYPFRFSKDTWEIFDVITAIVLIIFLFAPKKIRSA